jgi:hypothetical protein
MGSSSSKSTAATTANMSELKDFIQNEHDASTVVVWCAVNAVSFC